MNGEAKVESVLALEKQIREHEKAIINLKRDRNALLNISTLPPEVLGRIFQWNVTLQCEFGGLEDGSHNFLFVCHHWHEVTLHTPGVWSFWGNTLSDWARWYRYSATAPLDLVLGPGDQYEGGPFDGALHDTLQDRTARDTTRRIHLWTEDASLFSSIISSLTTVCEGVRSNSVESIILVNEGGDSEPMDVSEFFSHYRFPKLQHLNLYGCRITSWDLFTSRTAVLTTLILHSNDPPPTLMTSQLLPILASNPTLRKLSLSGCTTLPHDYGGKFHLRVSLHYLKELRLAGAFQDVFGLLHRLDHPGKMDDLKIILSDCAVTDIPHTIGPYLRDHFRRHGKSSNGLGLHIAEVQRHIILRFSDIRGAGTAPGKDVDWFFQIDVCLDRTPSDILEKGVLDLIAHTPQDDIVRFESLCGLAAVEDISAQFPNLRELHFERGFEIGTIRCPPYFRSRKLVRMR